MIVVADTTPINHLILVDKIFVLPELLGRVIIPTAVFSRIAIREDSEKCKRVYRKSSRMA